MEGNITIFIAIAALISLYLIVKAVGKRKGEEANIQNIIETSTTEEEVDESDGGELVAIIAAAIAASLDVSVPQIRIREIRRIPQNTPLWADMGRREQMRGI